jgi:putative toxin-antitoxin system antitoxin component (TIGR02293 family)
MSESDELPRPLLQRAIQVFDSEPKARRWLTRPHHLLDGSTPAAAAATVDGRAAVEDLLGRIEHGVYG